MRVSSSLLRLVCVCPFLPVIPALSQSIHNSPVGSLSLLTLLTVSHNMFPLTHITPHHRRCGVPARHLVYQHTGHSDFVMKWPLMGRGALEAASELLEAEAAGVLLPSDSQQAEDAVAQLQMQVGVGQAVQGRHVEGARGVNHRQEIAPPGVMAAGDVRPVPQPPPVQQLPHRHVLLGGLPDFGRDLVRIVRSGGRSSGGRPVARPPSGGGALGTAHVQVGLARLSRL